MTKIKAASVPTGIKFSSPAEATEYVYGYALRNYDCRAEAWDHVIECFDRAEVADLVKNCKTAAGAVSLVRCHYMLPLLAERRNEVCGEF